MTGSAFNGRREEKREAQGQHAAIEQARWQNLLKNADFIAVLCDLFKRTHLLGGEYYGDINDGRDNAQRVIGKYFLDKVRRYGGDDAAAAVLKALIEEMK